MEEVTDQDHMYLSRVKILSLQNKALLQSLAVAAGQRRLFFSKHVVMNPRSRRRDVSSAASSPSSSSCSSEGQMAHEVFTTSHDRYDDILEDK